MDLDTIPLTISYERMNKIKDNSILLMVFNRLFENILLFHKSDVHFTGYKK